MKRIPFLLVLIFVLVQSCVIMSLHPLYTDDTIVYLEGIEGKWSDDSAEEPTNYMEITRQQKGYELSVYGEEGDTTIHEIVIVELGGKYFADFYKPVAKESLTNSLAYHYPTHNFARLKMNGNKMEWYFFDGDYLKKLFEQRKIRIKHERVDDDIILTASSEELQKFIQKYADDPEAFDGGDVYLRKL